MGSETSDALDLQWLTETMLETNEEENDSSTLELTERIVEEMLSLQPTNNGDDNPRFVPHDEFLENCRNFTRQYEEFLQATRQNTVFDTLDLRIESPRCAPIYDALCSLLPNLHTLDLMFSSSASSIVTTARIIEIASPKIRTLNLQMYHASNDGEEEEAQVDFDSTTVDTFRSALESCTNVESLTWHMDTPRELLEGSFFPKLKDLTFHCYDHVNFFNLEDAARMILRHSSTLISLCLITVRYRGANDLIPLNQALGSLQKLQTLRFFALSRTRCTVRLEDEPYADLAATIAQLPNLTQSLHLQGCDFPFAFFEKLSESLFHHLTPHRIHELYIRLWHGDTRWEDSFRSIVRAIRDGSSSSSREHIVVRRLDLQPASMDRPIYGRELFGDIFTLVTCTGMEHLGLLDFPPLSDSQAVIKIITKALAWSTTCLRSLQLDLQNQNEFSKQEFLDIIHAIARNKHTRMEQLLVSFRPDHETRMAVLDAIQNTPTLTDLHAAWETRGNKEMPQSEKSSLFTALSRNYYLQNIDRFSPYDLSGTNVNIILQLNKAGRRYLVDDTLSVAAKVQKGVEVLIQVANNLDCLFYHLRENPSLCCNIQQNSVHDNHKPSTGPLTLETIRQEETCSSRKRKQIE